MSEIQSAREFAEMHCVELIDDLADSIRARDKAIVERIRERMEAELLHCDLDETDITLILDDVLRELGGEQCARGRKSYGFSLLRFLLAELEHQSQWMPSS